MSTSHFRDVGKRCHNWSVGVIKHRFTRQCENVASTSTSLNGSWYLVVGSWKIVNHKFTLIDIFEYFSFATEIWRTLRELMARKAKVDDVGRLQLRVMSVVDAKKRIRIFSPLSWGNL